MEEIFYNCFAGAFMWAGGGSGILTCYWA